MSKVSTKNPCDILICYLPNLLLWYDIISLNYKSRLSYILVNNYARRVMDAPGRLLGTGEAKGSNEAIPECNSSFS